MFGVAGAGDDGEIRAPAAHPLHQPHHLHRIVHGQDERAGMAEVELVEQFGPGGVAEDQREALGPRRLHRIDVESTAT